VREAGRGVDGLKDTKMLRLRHRINDLEDRIEDLEQIVNDLVICFASLENYVRRMEKRKPNRR